jgi:5-formyltetrahydrofolate cyclo-ligase
MMMQNQSKSDLRRRLRDSLASMTDAQRHAKSLAACTAIAASPEYRAASVVMLYLPMLHEVDTALLALKCWQDGKKVVVPKVSWDQRRMLPVEITSLTSGLTTSGMGVREPSSGNPIPLYLVDLVIVPGLGFTEDGYRIGRGMGFYDRFLAQNDFLGVSCGLAFEEQIVPSLPLLDHDMPLSMLATDAGIRRFTSNCIDR